MERTTADNLADAREQAIRADADWHSGKSASQVIEAVTLAIRYLQSARDGLRVHMGD